MSINNLNIKKGDLSGNIFLFYRILRKNRIEVTPKNLIDALRSLLYVEIKKKGDFKHALRTNFTSTKKDMELFDILFEEFFTGFEKINSENILPPEDESEDMSSHAEEEKDKREIIIENWCNKDSKNECMEKEELPGYSSLEVLSTKDFSNLSPSEMERINEIIVKIAPKITRKRLRRKKAHPKGEEFDLRRSIRKNLSAYGGEIIELKRRKRKIVDTAIVLLCDVSGSMDCYTRFFIQFIYGFQNNIKGMETFVFSTRLSRVTHILKKGNFKDALNEISRRIKHWSGGTNIGYCLQHLNNNYGWMVGRKTVVIVVSDGWDRGDTELLEKEIRRLKRNSHKLIWLNPLLGSPDYKPICKGIKTALPYTSYFLPLHNLNSLIMLSKTLKSVI
ncbi:MAG: VWA domain-containing protein [Thermodesulfobacteriota bacterium]|nr:VWA domain-containing protein [Thermodesulfobacteriota bacterium]